MTLKLVNGRALQVPGLLRVPAYDYAALESLDEFRSVAANADVLWAVDLSRDNNQAIVFGEGRLHDILLAGEAASLKIVAFGIDFTTDRVEHLLAATANVKGHFEWNGEVHKIDGAEATKIVFGEWGMGKCGGVRS